MHRFPPRQTSPAAHLSLCKSADIFAGVHLAYSVPYVPAPHPDSCSEKSRDAEYTPPPRYLRSSNFARSHCNNTQHPQIDLSGLEPDRRHKPIRQRELQIGSPTSRRRIMPPAPGPMSQMCLVRQSGSRSQPLRWLRSMAESRTIACTESCIES